MYVILKKKKITFLHPKFYNTLPVSCITNVKIFYKLVVIKTPRIPSCVWFATKEPQSSDMQPTYSLFPVCGYYLQPAKWIPIQNISASIIDDKIGIKFLLRNLEVN